MMPTRKQAARASVLPAAGSTRFEQARRRVAKSTAREVEQVPDAEVVTYLTKGAQAMRDALSDGPFGPPTRPS